MTTYPYQRAVRGSCKVSTALDTQTSEDKPDFVLFLVIIYPSTGPRTYILSSVPATAPHNHVPFQYIINKLFSPLAGLATPFSLTGMFGPRLLARLHPSYPSKVSFDKTFPGRFSLTILSRQIFHCCLTCYLFKETYMSLLQLL